ncbi:MAG: TolC family protein, partial [Acidobacteriota bacterium]|nr:TolC family protein [Acidobacteriota bacterium]
QAELKRLLNRPQTSPDIVPSQAGAAPLSYTFDELLGATQSQNPQISGSRDVVEREKLQVELAHKDFRPDFNLQYMWQRTDPERYRAYYMLTLGVSLPIHRSKLHAELAQAQANLSQSEDELQSQSQEIASELRVEYDTAQKTSDLLEIDREGLIPQARAAFQSAIAAYQNNRQDFQPVLDAFLEVLHLDEQFSEHLSQREVALAHLEELTGLPLRDEAVRQ